MSQSDGEERPTDHMTTPALKKLAHIRNVTPPPRRSHGSIWGRVRVNLQGQKCPSWSGSLSVCERAYMCVKSLQNKDLRYEHFVVMQLRTCFKCPRGTYNLLTTAKPPYYSRCVTLEDQQPYSSLLPVWPALSRRQSREVQLLFLGVGKGYTSGHVTNLKQEVHHTFPKT